MRKPLLHVVLVTALAAGLPALAADHPLDPLSHEEVWRTLVLLRDAGHMNKDTKFSQLALQEPAKRDVLAWKPSEPMPRRAYALARKDSDTFEAIVDLAADEVVSWQPLEGAEPNWHGSEYGSLTDKVLEHPDFLAGLEARGITDLTFVDCSAGPRGYFGTEEELGRRIAHVSCDEPGGVSRQAVEGLVAVVDLETEEVLRVVDEGPGPIRAVPTDFRDMLGEAREIAGPIEIRQPLGHGFEVDGYRVSWQNWSFHLRPDQRTGLVVSLVDYRESPEAAARRVLYQGHLSEIFVPYMDPRFGWYTLNFIDAGEFVSGGLGKPLMPGDDCPDHALYVDSTKTGANGYPRTVPGTICVYERETGDPSWRHYSGERPESRKSRDLVVRVGGNVGNYDYLLDWIFRQDGSIEVRVGATGILAFETTAAASAVRPVPAAGPANPAAADALLENASADAYGRFVQENVVAVNHDHYFSFRLDIDVDGTDNRFVADRLVARSLPDGHPRRSLWVQEPRIASSEHDARLNIDLNRPTLWRVQSTSRRNAVGYPTSFQVMPGRNTNTLLSADDYPRRRAGFIDHHLWVTPQHDAERFAAGDHPTLSEPGMGLPEWTEADRPIEDTDIVLWHTVGMHHLPRAEDWPVMPTLWHGFELRPFDFFDRNPALDLP